MFLTKYFLVNANSRWIIFNLFSKIFSSRTRRETFLATVKSQWLPSVAWQLFFGCSLVCKGQWFNTSKAMEKINLFHQNLGGHVFGFEILHCDIPGSFTSMTIISSSRRMEKNLLPSIRSLIPKLYIR